MYVYYINAFDWNINASKIKVITFGAMRSSKSLFQNLPTLKNFCEFFGTHIQIIIQNLQNDMFI